MTDFEAWLTNNEDYLAAAVAWIHVRLEQSAAQNSRAAQPAQPATRIAPETLANLQPRPPAAESSWRSHLLRDRPGPAAPEGGSSSSAPAPLEPAERLTAQVDSDPASLALAQMQNAAAASPPPAAIWLRNALKLTDFELHILLLCAAMEFHTHTATLCARAQGDPSGQAQRYPTFALAMALFDDPSWDVLSPERPLRAWRLVEITQSSGLTTSMLRADERIVNFLKGLNYLDDRLAPFFMPLLTLEQVPNARPANLSPSQIELAAEVAHRLAAGKDTSAEVLGPAPFAARYSARLPLVQLTGPAAQDKALLASEVARSLGYGLYRLPAAALPVQPADLDQLARLWRREATLLPFGLYLDASEISAGTPDTANSLIERLLSRLDGLTFLACREPWPGLEPDALLIEVDRPTSAEQAGAWQAVLGPQAGEIAARLANQFNLSLPEISGIATRQKALAQASLPGLWNACLERSRPRLDLLAERIEPRSNWNDLVLPDEARRLLQEIAAQVDHRPIVYEAWGFRRKMSRGLGISALFAGESGVGKTMAAEVIANELDLNLYRIDLSAVVSKYIGETEKNLRRLFDAADGGGAILFFDEADALFGKRSEVKDSHDRYANIEINYLLQRMEAYTGLAILATNMKSALDPAFTRRLRFIVNFPIPGPAERKLIWQKVFPPDTPLEMADPGLKIDYDRLAKVNLTGGSIHNAALNAAFRAARAGTKVTMPVLVEAIHTELKKSDRAVLPI